MFLNREILRETKTKQLDSMDSSTNSSVLGDMNSPFEFSQCKPINVDFAESVLYSQEENEIDINEVTEWLHKFY